MARKFLYVVAATIVVILAFAMALRWKPQELSELAFVPSAPFTQLEPLASDAYASAEMWLLRPDFGDKSSTQLMPAKVANDDGPIAVPVFYIHPTSFLGRSAWNASLNDNDSRERATMFLRLAISPFLQSTQVFAPRYRQATFGAFLVKDERADKALDVAYDDVRLAFAFFFDSLKKDTPFVIAGHSQGAYLAKRLLRDIAANPAVKPRLLAAYLLGWPVSLRHDLPSLGFPACRDQTQRGCVVSWLSVAEPADPAMFVSAFTKRRGLDGQYPAENDPFLCSNPITGGIGGAAPASANHGTLVADSEFKTATLEKGLAAAKCRNDGFLSVGVPPDLGPYVLPGNNYHIYDTALFWADLRADFERRTQQVLLAP